MLTVGAGRILFWEGGSMWVLTAGPTVGAEGVKGTFHSHHAVQVTLALDGWFELETADLKVKSPAAAVAPDTPHAIRAGGTVAFLYIEPESHAGRMAMGRLFETGSLAPVGWDLFGNLPGNLIAAFRNPAVSDATLKDIGRALIARLSGDLEAATADERISRVIEWAAAHVSTAMTLADAAAVAGLSPDRMRHLFVQHTGLPFRTYVLWLRLLNAVESYARGDSLTDAAHAAGFADSAHFSRTFRRMFGFAAAELRLS
jgi:AraC-like DNA-binding protein